MLELLIKMHVLLKCTMIDRSRICESSAIFEPPHEKTNNVVFEQVLIQTGLYSHRIQLEA